MEFDIHPPRTSLIESKMSGFLLSGRTKPDMETTARQRSGEDGCAQPVCHDLARDFGRIYLERTNGFWARSRRLEGWSRELFPSMIADPSGKSVLVKCWTPGSITTVRTRYRWTGANHDSPWEPEGDATLVACAVETEVHLPIDIPTLLSQVPGTKQ